MSLEMKIDNRDRVNGFYLIEPRLFDLVESCKTEMKACEVWLFGSRARGDHHQYSDWDILAVVRNDAPERIENPVAAYHLR